MGAGQAMYSCAQMIGKLNASTTALAIINLIGVWTKRPTGATKSIATAMNGKNHK
jgi:hypothetical protein